MRSITRPGVQRAQHLVAHAPAFERAGAEVLDQHVGLGDEPARDVLALGAAQVERERALVARLHLPPHRGAVLQQAPVAQRVAAAGRFDLDDVGAEFAERLAGEGPGDELAHLDDAQALQGAGGGMGKPRSVRKAGFMARFWAAGLAGETTKARTQLSRIAKALGG
jgi:hypothetical protein